MNTSEQNSKDSLSQESVEINNEKSIPQWIRELFSQTWDPELILSGILIYALIQLPGFIEKGVDFLRQWHLPGTGILYVMLSLSSRALLFTFIFHLILRGAWIGMVGLNSVFTAGIRYDRLNYSPFFRKRLEKNTLGLSDMITMLDQVCSVLFSFAFLFILLCISVFLWAIVSAFYIRIVEYISGDILTDILALVFFIASGIYFIDFVTLGIFKKNETISRIYFPIYWFFSIVTMAFLYRTIYYTFISNLSHKRWILYFFTYLILVTGISYTSIAAKMHWPRIWGRGAGPEGIFQKAIQSREFMTPTDYYDNRRPEGKQSPVSIPSDIIRENFLRVFIQYNNSDDDNILLICPESLGMDSIKDENIKSRVAINCLKDYYRVYINDSLYSDLEYTFSITPANQGIVTFIPIHHLKNGKNVLEIRLNRTEDKWNLFIPFIIDREMTGP